MLNIFNWGRGKQPSFGDLKSHPNARTRDMLELASDAKKRKILVELKEMSQALTQKEISNWRTANQYALNFENPKRILLYDIYYDALLDDHLYGAIRNRKLKVMQTSFKLMDQSGKENEEATKLMKSRWFKQFMSLALDSIFHGHSLIQMGDIIRDPKLKFTHVELLPRKHVVPEYHVVIKEINDEPKKGFDYLKPPFTDWCISVGDPKDLGLLLPVSKDTISKKYALQFWDQFAEIFGMPVRIGKSSTRNKADRDKIEQMLEDMGSAAWGLFPEGTEIEIVETKRGDAYNVYDKRIARSNSEISKAISGQTMTMDDGSSKSQAEVHADVADDIAEADADFLRDVVNDDLIPLLIKHGFPFNNLTFEWDDTYEYSPTELREVEDMLLDHYVIDPNYFQEKYNITITGVKETATATSAEGDEKKKLVRFVSQPAFEFNCCDHAHDLILLNSDPQQLQQLSDGLIRFAWDNRNAPFSYDYYVALSDIYRDALARGWQNKQQLKLAKLSNPVDVPLSFGSPDQLTMQIFDLNLFRFSAAKSAAAVRELNELAKSSDTFNDFKGQAGKVTDRYNNDYLRTEYDFAWNTSHNAAQYHRMLAIKEQFPTWQYLTAGDERVRPAHKVLHGMKFKADDPAFDTIYPPNGWGCRCYVKALTGTATKYSTKAEAEKLLAGSAVDKNGNSELDRMIKGRFNKNRAKTGVIFDEDKFYIKNDIGKKLTYKEQGLKAESELDRNSYPSIKVQERDLAFAGKILSDNDNLFADYAKRAIGFSKKTLKANGAQDQLNIVEFIPAVMKNPSEVYLVETGSSKTIQLKYIKHYKDRSLVVVSDAADKGFDLKTWLEADKDTFDKEWRTGILIK